MLQLMKTRLFAWAIRNKYYMRFVADFGGCVQDVILTRANSVPMFSPGKLSTPTDTISICLVISDLLSFGPKTTSAWHDREAAVQRQGDCYCFTRLGIAKKLRISSLFDSDLSPRNSKRIITY